MRQAPVVFYLFNFSLDLGFPHVVLKVMIERPLFLARRYQIIINLEKLIDFLLSNLDFSVQSLHFLKLLPLERLIIIVKRISRVILDFNVVHLVICKGARDLVVRNLSGRNLNNYYILCLGVLAIFLGDLQSALPLVHLVH